MAFPICSQSGSFSARNRSLPGRPRKGQPMTKTKITGPVRVRFAPSPTGFLHVGGARTAIYNELLRQSLGGAMILRIEDTDRARSDAAMTEQIVSGLRWIGVEWDEGPELQSAGLARHQAAAARLLEEGKAYHDFVSPAAVDEKRQEAQRAKQNFRYKDHFPTPAADEVARRIAAGRSVRGSFPDARHADRGRRLRAWSSHVCARDPR